MANPEISLEAYNLQHFRPVTEGFVSPRYQWFDISSYSWKPTSLRPDEQLPITPFSPPYREPVTPEAIAATTLVAEIERLRRVGAKWKDKVVGKIGADYAVTLAISVPNTEYTKLPDNPSALDLVLAGELPANKLLAMKDDEVEFLAMDLLATTGHEPKP